MNGEGESLRSPQPAWDLFPRTNHLRPLTRVFHGFFAVVGTLIVLFVLFFVVLEISTTPGASALAVWLGVVCSLVSAAHVVWEARSAKPISWGRWTAFAVAQAVFGYELWTTIRDPTAKRVFLYALLAGGSMLLIARWIVTRTTARPFTVFEERGMLAEGEQRHG
jgi:hypothetical protein